MSVTIVLPQIFLPQNSVKLGRLTTSVEHPHQSHHDPPAASPPPMLTSLHASYTGEQHVSNTSGFGSTLTSLLSAGFSKRAKTRTRVTTEHVKTYILDDSDAWFDEATRLPVTRRWLERAFDRGQDVYMVVGFHTVTNASVTQESVAGRSAEGQITVPAGLSLAAAGVVVPLGSALDPGVAVYQQGYEGTQSQFVAPGEHICAVQYRKIRHQWLSSKHVDKARLSDVRQWSSMERARDEEDGEDDIVEVDFTDVHELDGDWDKQTVNDEAIRSTDRNGLLVFY
ncbi:hypothetical protein GE09DRAFT_988271 [Coniochaeta sp. 2T2.1]|nr:hypothetical protein GE09DRAFT_988271 [Coniochaeta sp. 2T2.1]